MRSALEGLAARLVVEGQKDLTPMDEAWVEMQRAVVAEDVRGLLKADLDFHLALCSLSGNRFLQEHARRLLIPLFAFVLMRVHTNQRGSSPWAKSIDLVASSAPCVLVILHSLKDLLKARLTTSRWLRTTTGKRKPINLQDTNLVTRHFFSGGCRARQWDLVS